MAQDPANTFGIKTVDRSGSDAQEMYDEAKDAALEGMHRVKEAAIAGEDFLRNFIEKQPYTATVIALTIGVLIGYTSHRPEPRRGFW
jgi:ElaB/YqjD/DUF883 family membrane-anchored ribosome-binding protein